MKSSSSSVSKPGSSSVSMTETVGNHIRVKKKKIYVIGHIRDQVRNIGGQSGKQSFQKRWKQQWAHKNETKDPNAMDVDLIQLKLLSNKERQTLSKEGRCFCCRQKGHMSQSCPQGMGQKQTFTPQTNTRTTE